MPICRHCLSEFEGSYRKKYCSEKCQFMYRTQINLNGCWLWTGSKTASGYGVINKLGKIDYSHRISYKLHIGEIPDGMFVCHKCDNPSCVNPEHIFLGTHQDNMEDMRNKGRAAWANSKMFPDIVAKRSLARKGKPISKEQLKALHDGRKLKLQDPEWVEKVYSKMRGANNPNSGKMSNEARERYKSYWESLRGKSRAPHTEETKAKMREAYKKRMGTKDATN